MKILIATDCYIHNMGGVTASILALCIGLRRSGHEVRVLSLSDGGRSSRDGDDYFIRSLPAFFYPDMRVSFAGRDPLLRELEDWRPDVVHIQTEGSARWLALKIAKRCRVPVVMTCHTDYAHFVFGALRSRPPVKALMRAVGKRLYRPAVRIIAPSRKAAHFPFLQGVRERVTVVPNGMEIEKYRPRFSEEERRAFRASLGFDDRAGVLTAITRLSREKNIQELISYLPALLQRQGNTKLLIVGDGPDRKHLEKLTEELGLQDSVRFTGRIPADEVWRYYSAGDVFVSASTFEVHSMSYLEALANGLPLLCRADDALDGVLEHGEDGFIYHSQEEFVEFAGRLLSDDRLRGELAARSLRKAEDFSCGAFADAALKVYEDAIRACTQGGERMNCACGV